MDILTGIAVIGGICVLVLLIGAIKRGTVFVWNFVLRVVLGFVAIYFVNQGIAMMGYPKLSVGINLISFLTCGTLGFPGLAVLYGFMAYKLL